MSLRTSTASAAISSYKVPNNKVASLYRDCHDTYGVSHACLRYGAGNDTWKIVCVK